MEPEPEVLLDTFQRSFLSCRRVASFPWHDLDQVVKQDPLLISQILEKTVLHPLCQKYPPSPQYRRLFLSELIRKHESSGAEPLDDLYDALAEALNSEETTRCHKSYLLPLGESVTLCENVAIISEGTTGLVTWEAALSLADWSIENKDIFKNRSILELGSGIGLTGLVICKSCSPKRYLFSDYHNRVLQQLRGNIHLNGYNLDTEQDNLMKEKNVKEYGEAANPESVQVSVMELNWDLVTEEQLLQLQVDVVIASDGRHLKVIVASTIRNPETYDLFHTTLDKAGLMWQVVPVHKKTIFPYNTDNNVEILNVCLKV
ncbi:uncharacterized protein LOC735173 isoform X2 [Xenopus laevis]|uniref:FAM86 N-terminal domain-containing protein n=2 Tax=Xenopus laevis TaxID=8355 RepID=A0A974H411_XENLA|nr:uncharacterized protein LOC735173 isoform X2 [Xenopus laevis]OCT64009.1 hypothetical protein XELAEV_18045107mg [Xenopus laevis]